MPKKILKNKSGSECTINNDTDGSFNDSINQQIVIEKCQLDQGSRKEIKKNQFEEKQRQKMMEKLKKDEDRKLREEDKKRKEAEKELERKKKELEKEEEKKKKEADKKQKEFEKDEEKRKKEEERRLKEIEREEEKRRKEEERKKKEEDKRKEEDERRKMVEKQRAMFVGFLKKEKNDQDSLDIVTCDLINVGCFKPIEVKKDMKMSSIERIKKKTIKSLLDISNSAQTYLNELFQGKCGNGNCLKTWSLPEPEVEIASSKRLKTKSLLFVENIRPPYFGTWRKKSHLITPLNPLVEDKLFFDYELDSDQEWEYESGEDIAASDNEDDEEINDEPVDTSFLVPHGYLSDGEDIMDLDPDEDIIAYVKKKPITIESKQILIDIREKQFQAEVKQQIHQINPNITGPCFVNNVQQLSISQIPELYNMICRTGEGFPINCNLQADHEYSANSSKIKSVPPEAVPHIIRLVHCNQMSRAKLCYEFRMYWEFNLTKKLPDVSYDNDLQGKDWDEFSIGKKRFFEKLKEIADWKDGMWIVKPEVIQEYQLCCLDDDSSKPCTEKWKYVSEVVKIESKKISNRSQNSKKRKVQTESLSIITEKSKET